MVHGLAEGPAWLVALEGSGLGHSLRSSLWLYPLVETLHILGFALLVGSIVAFDLRLISAPRGFDVEGWVRLLIPISASGLILAMAMGFLLFTTEATAYVRNPLFLAKMALLVLAPTSEAVQPSPSLLGPAREPLAFAAVGSLGFAVDAAILTALVNGLGAGPYAARLASFAVVVTLTWTLNRRLTFRAGRQGGTRYALYVLLAGIGIAVNMGVYALCLAWLPWTGVYPAVAAAFGTLTAMSLNFLTARHLVFARPSSGTRG
jgi:putative flippase GtrA